MEEKLWTVILTGNKLLSLTDDAWIFGNVNGIKCLVTSSVLLIIFLIWLKSY